MNMGLLRDLHKLYSCRKDRQAAWARQGEFILEDAVKMMRDAENPIDSKQVNMVFGMSKHSIVVNESDDFG